MKYRLPDALGGNEYEEYRNSDGSTEAPAGTVAFLESGCIFAVARALLVEVEEPLPPEPPDGAVVRIRRDALTFVAERDDQTTTASGEWHWYTTHVCDPSSWSEVAHNATEITRLVPDPFGKPVNDTCKPGDRVLIEAKVLGTSVSARPRVRTVRPGLHGSTGYFDMTDVTVYPFPTNEPLADWERDLLEGGRS